MTPNGGRHSSYIPLLELQQCNNAGGATLLVGGQLVPRGRCQGSLPVVVVPDVYMGTQQKGLCSAKVAVLGRTGSHSSVIHARQKDE